MAENAERGVVFVLRTQIDPSARAMLDQFAAEVQAKQAAVDSSITASAAAAAAAVAQNASAASTQVQTYSGVSQDAVQQFLATTQQAEQAYFEQSAQRRAQQAQAQEEARNLEAMSLEELMAEREAISRAGYEREKEAHNKALEEERLAMEAYFAAIEELRQRALADAESITDEEIIAVAELEKAAIDSVESREKADAKFRTATARERTRSVNEAIDGIERENDAHERSAAEIQRRNEQISTSAGRIVSAISEGSEAVMRLARGFAHLGLVGETDLQKLQDSLLWIQGSTEIFTGLVRSIKQVSEGYEAYRKMILLTAEAQAALNAATAAGAVVQGAAGAAAGSVARTGSGVAGDIAGGVAGGASASLMTRLAMGGTAAGGSIVGAGSAIGLEAGASALGVFAAAIGAAVGAVAGLTSAALTAREALKFGAGEGATKGGIVESIGTSRFNPFFQLMMLDEENGKKSDTGQAYADAEAAEKKLKLAQEQRKLNLELQKRDEAEITRMKAEQASIANQQAAIEKEMESARMAALTPEERRAELVKQIVVLQTNAALSAEERGREIIDLSRQRLQAEQEIHRTQLQAAQDAEREDQRKLADVNQRIEAERNSMLSAQERFGLMTGEEQQGVLDITQRFRQGAGNVDAEELRKIRGFSGAMDEQIAAEARRRAQAAGFGQVQAQDVQRLQGLERERATIEANIKADATVIAKLEVDSRQVADQINQQINAQFKVIMQSMAEKIGKTALDVEKLEAAMLQRFAKL
jgi:hypothetical protein